MIKWIFSLVLIFILISIIYPLSFIASIDVSFIRFFEEIRTEFLTDLFLLISDIGSIKVILPITFFVVFVLVIRRDFIGAIYLLVLFFGVRAFNYELKGLFSRDRPDFEAVYEAAYYSFPSGHSMNSAASYSFICFILLVNFMFKSSVNATLVSFTSILILLIGLSRVYLGVHFITDVAAGFLAGIAWCLVVVLLYRQTKTKFDKKSNV
ncbi:phosphatase PAP2 family protein [Metabacillus herbersteinensis]|uniref:Phosphatase PAP2 family protein n=1 Tax=Metabacillus herbersteinensis TaxID=283816 RepID=A0ABV6GKV8_9BACI